MAAPHSPHRQPRLLQPYKKTPQHCRGVF